MVQKSRYVFTVCVPIEEGGDLPSLPVLRNTTGRDLKSLTKSGKSPLVFLHITFRAAPPPPCISMGCPTSENDTAPLWTLRGAIKRQHVCKIKKNFHCRNAQNFVRAQPQTIGVPIARFAPLFLFGLLFFFFLTSHHHYVPETTDTERATLPGEDTDSNENPTGCLILPHSIEKSHNFGVALYSRWFCHSLQVNAVTRDRFTASECWMKVTFTSL